MWSSMQVRPGIWVGFTDTSAGNLAFHVNDDPDGVKLRRASLASNVCQDLAQELPANHSPGLGGSAHLTYMNQVHGSHVEVIDAAVIDAGGPRSEAPTADAMVLCCAAPKSAAPKSAGPLGEESGGGEFIATGLSVMVADCVPVVCLGMTATGIAVLAVAHAGRPGVEQGVIANVVAQMRASGAVNIEAWLGPSICGRCYEVPEAMRATVSQKVSEAFASTSWGTPALDLPAAVLAQLRNAGVTGHPSGICTLEDQRYFSHRRSQRDGEPEGRFIGFIAAASGLFHNAGE